VYDCPRLIHAIRPCSFRFLATSTLSVFVRLPIYVIIWLHPIPSFFPYTTLFRSFRLNANSFSSESISFSSICFGNLSCSHMLPRSEEHTSELQSRFDLVCRLLLEINKIRPGADIGDHLAPRDALFLIIGKLLLVS